MPLGVLHAEVLVAESCAPSLDPEGFRFVEIHAAEFAVPMLYACTVIEVRQVSEGEATSCQSGVINTAKVILMNSSFLSIAQSAPRTFSATSAEPRCSTKFESSMMVASRASWFSLIFVEQGRDQI